MDSWALIATALRSTHSWCPVIFPLGRALIIFPLKMDKCLEIILITLFGSLYILDMDLVMSLKQPWTSVLIRGWTEGM